MLTFNRSYVASLVRSARFSVHQNKAVHPPWWLLSLPLVPAVADAADDIWKGTVDAHGALPEIGALHQAGPPPYRAAAMSSDSIKTARPI